MRLMRLEVVKSARVACATTVRSRPFNLTSLHVLPYQSMRLAIYDWSDEASDPSRRNRFKLAFTHYIVKTGYTA